MQGHHTTMLQVQAAAAPRYYVRAPDERSVAAAQPHVRHPFPRAPAPVLPVVLEQHAH